MGSLDAILEHAPGRFIDLVAPRPLLMILAKDDAIAPPDSIREAFNRAGGPKRLLEVEGGHYAVYTGTPAKKTGQAATEWFIEHLLHRKPIALRQRISRTNADATTELKNSEERGDL